MKKEVIPKDARYVPLTQQKWCCVPTCIQMVMLRHRIPLVSAELMGYYLRIVVPKADGKLFWNVRTTTKRPKAGYGTQLNEEFTANPMFQKLKIPLRMRWKLIDTFDSYNAYQKYVKKCISSGQDVLVCYDYGTLFDDDYHGGHVCVLDRVYMKKGETRIIDPGAKEPKWRTVRIQKLYEAMKYHGRKNMGGFWEVVKR